VLTPEIFNFHQFDTKFRQSYYCALDPGSFWWWCQDKNGKQGYVLREILSLNPPTSI